jgi:penicillin-binding protein 1B
MSFRRILKVALIGAVAVIIFTAVPALYFFLTYYHSLEDDVVTRFSQKHWNIPSRIYSDSTIVYPGQTLKDLGFFERLARLNYHRVPNGKVTERGEYSYDQSHGTLVIFLHNFSYPYREFPGEIVQIDLSRNEVIQDISDLDTHKPAYSIEIEPELLSGIFEGDWEQRRLVPLSQIPPAFIDAILAAEDHRFYEHHGFDVARTLKAGWIDLTSRHVRQGGSTLTQQLIKNVMLTPERSFKRKLKELVMAYITETKYTKEEILENYINDIYLGQRGQEGIYGIWEASEYYFSKEPRDLSIGEMASIAGMISSPNRLNPMRHPDLAKIRRDEVLASMMQYGYISKPAYDAAHAESLHPRETFTETNDAPYFVDYVKKELSDRYSSDVLTQEGLRIFTTLDVHAEKLAEQSIDDNLTDLETKYPKLKRREENERLEECLVSLEPGSGKIRAMIGGRNYQRSQFNRVTQSKRQPGSAFKIVTYAAAFDETLTGGPVKYLPTSYVDDTQWTWNYAENMSWTPNNYKDRYFGQVTLEFALQESLNAAASRIANAIGLDRVVAMGKKLGFGDLPMFPSIVLGGIEVAPIQLAEAYSIIASDGMDVHPYAVTAVLDQNGKVMEGHELQAEQRISPQLAYMMQFMLEQVMVGRGTGAGARTMGFRRPAAGKTGTTNDAKDAWFAGFTPNLLTVVWTGFDQKEDLKLTGAQASLPAWTNFMKAATATRPALNFVMPPGLVQEVVDPTTGYKATPYCPVRIDGVFPQDSAPTQLCPVHGGPLQAASTTTTEHPVPTVTDSEIDDSVDPND